MSFNKQIVNNVAPVVLLSTFLVKHEHVEEFLAGFRKQFATTRKQPGPQLKQYPPGTEVSAFMFQRVAVPGMCLGEPVASD